jgi:peroxidase
LKRPTHNGLKLLLAVIKFLAMRRAHYLAFICTLLQLTSAFGQWRMRRNTHYSNVCDNFEQTVADVVSRRIQNDRGMAARLLRLYFHDCFVNGCDASVLLDNDNQATERYSEANFNLGGLDVIDEIKQVLDARCGPVVSCADITAAAARDAVVAVGGPSWTIELGRLDGAKSLRGKPTDWLTGPVNQVTRGITGKSLLGAFQDVGLDVVDLVTLSGAHAIGSASCRSSVDRWQNRRTVEAIDSRLKGYLAEQCGSNIDQNMALNFQSASRSSSGIPGIPFFDFFQPGPRFTAVAQNNTFSNSFYVSLKLRLGALTSDQTLASHAFTRDIVDFFAENQDGFFSSFRHSMRRMGRIRPATVGHKVYGEKSDQNPDGNEYGIRVGSCTQPSGLVQPSVGRA